MEKYMLKQEEKELIDSVTFDNDTQCAERRDLTRSREIPSDNEEIRSDKDLKIRLRIPLFLATSIVMFFLLVSMGVRNINFSTSKASQRLPAPIESVPEPEVLSETEEVPPAGPLREASRKVKPESTLTVKLDDASLSVNIREQPATDSAKIGKASDGDTFEFVSKEQEWYEVKLASGSGFISADYIIEEEVSN